MHIRRTEKHKREVWRNSQNRILNYGTDNKQKQKFILRLFPTKKKHETY